MTKDQYSELLTLYGREWVKRRFPKVVADMERDEAHALADKTTQTNPETK